MGSLVIISTQLISVIVPLFVVVLIASMLPGFDSSRPYKLDDLNSDDISFDRWRTDQTVYNTIHLDLVAKVQNGTDHIDVFSKLMGGCGTNNPIDDCWRCNSRWRNRRQALASCAVGFGQGAQGGMNGPIYVVTNDGDDLENPTSGTLRYGVTRDGPLWITFHMSMTVKLKAELLVSSHKTIDARGYEIHITNQVTLQDVNHVILHGLHIHDVKRSSSKKIRVSPTKIAQKGASEGDGIHIMNSKNVWVDHCYLAKSTDGLLDVTRGSTDITISNNYFTNHDKTILLGAGPKDTMDRDMRVTIAFNKFGPNLNQRLPRARYGVVHILNNNYGDGWGSYAIGGSEDPTIFSEGNHFKAGSKAKEVTKHIEDGGPTFGGWKKWNWASKDDVFDSGAFFTSSGAQASSSGVYSKALSTSSLPASSVEAITKYAGPLRNL